MMKNVLKAKSQQKSLLQFLKLASVIQILKKKR